MRLPHMDQLDRYSSGVSSGMNGTVQESDVESRGQYQDSEYTEGAHAAKNVRQADY